MRGHGAARLAIILLRLLEQQTIDFEAIIRNVS